MKVAFNVSSFDSEHSRRGVGSYTKNLLENLKRISGLEIQEFNDLKDVDRVDIAHYPQFDLFNRTLPIFKRFPTVVTIHDVIPLLYPDHYPPGLRGKMKNFIQRFALKGIGGIITDSESSRKDIIQVLGVKPDKIFKVSLAASNNFKPLTQKQVLEKTKKHYKLPENFILYIGNVNWNKNIIKMTQACVELGVNIVLLGSSFEKSQDLNHPELIDYLEFKKSFQNQPGVYVLGYVEENDLVSIINLAKATILVSYYEGFGLPILESQACGVPVITSNLSSMPEVAGSGAFLVDPYEIVSIKSGIERVLGDEKLAKKLVLEGFENIQKFSWEKTAHETVKVYKEVLENA